MTPVEVDLDRANNAAMDTERIEALATREAALQELKEVTGESYRRP